jgi:hypothetical protein
VLKMPRPLLCVSNGAPGRSLRRIGPFHWEPSGIASSRPTRARNPTGGGHAKSNRGLVMHQPIPSASAHPVSNTA